MFDGGITRRRGKSGIHDDNFDLSLGCLVFAASSDSRVRPVCGLLATDEDVGELSPSSSQFEQLDEDITNNATTK